MQAAHGGGCYIRPDFDADGHLALKLVTRHGRATPLVWLSVLKDELKNARNDYEDACLRRLAEVLPLQERGYFQVRFIDWFGLNVRVLLLKLH